MGLVRSARFRGGIALAVLLPIAALAGSIALANGYSSPVPAPAPRTALATRPAHYLGIFETGAPGSYRNVTKFAAATGRHPDIALYFSGWDKPFATAFAQAARAHGAVPYVQLEPFNARLSTIAAGKHDAFLRRYAGQVRDYRYPVIISFAHEMNGNWYPWGQGHASPADFVGAWRHVVTIFRQQGANNVTWLWGIHSIGTTLSTMRAYWPGRKYVTWVGLDGYFALPTDTFRYVFGTTFSTVRRLTSAPVLISETAVGPATGHQPARITGLFAGIRRRHLLGLVWFDRAQHEGLHHQDWRLEDNPAAMAAFRRASKGYG